MINQLKGLMKSQKLEQSRAGDVVLPPRGSNKTSVMKEKEGDACRVITAQNKLVNVFGGESRECM